METKMKKVKGLALAILMTALLSIVAAAPAHADYAPINGGTVDLYKYVVVEEHMHSTPASSPVFRISPGAAPAGTPGSSLQVFSGKDWSKVVLKYGAATTPTVNSGYVQFTLDLDAQNTLTSGESGDGITSKAGQKYYKYPLTLDFSACEYTQPGVYRYLITEQNAGKTGMSPRSGYGVLTADVYVINKEGETTPTLQIGGIVVYQGTITSAPRADGTLPAGITKDNKFINDAKLGTIKISKKVEGSLADKTKSFNFTLTVAGAGNLGPDSNPATLADADAGYSTPANRPALTTGTFLNNRWEYTFSLKHGEQLVIKDIPIVSSSATYSVSEAGASGTSTRTFDGYIVTGEVTNAALDGDEAVEIVNKKGAVVPTGVLTMLVPGLVLIALAALVLMRRRSGARK